MNVSGRPVRPFGVTLIAFITLAAVLITLVGLAKGQALTTAPAHRPASARRLAQFGGVWSAVGLLTAAGLFGMRRWGLWAAVIYYAGTICFVAANLPRLEGSASNLVTVIFKVGFGVLVIWHLTSRDVRTAFRRR